MGLTDIVRKALLGGALATASVGAGAVALSVPAVAEAKELEELTPTNFAKKVYHNPKPVVVLFYEAETDKHGHQDILEAGWRMEKVVEELADKYNEQVAFFKVAIDHHSFPRKGDFQRTFDIDGYSPQVVMYGRFDVLSGRQSLHNEKLDIARGGPPSDEGISATSTNTDYWIQQNLFRRSPDGDGKLYRYEGTLKIHEVGELR